MHFYFILYILLWIFASLELFGRSKNLVYLLGFITILFLSLRFETGYDWPAYQKIFDLTPSFIDIKFEDIFEISTEDSKEPLFILFISFLKIASSEFQILLLACAILQISIFINFLQFLKENAATIFTLSVSWLLFTLYMSTLRQGLAVSFFLLFMLSMERRNWKIAVAMLAISLSFQYSAIIYFAMYLASNYIKWNKKLVFICSFLAITALFNIDFSTMTLQLISMAGIGMINEKIDWYLHGYSIPPNLFELIYNSIFSTSILIVLYFVRPSKNDSSIIKKMYGMSLIFCIICLLFYSFPLLRNRVQYLALPFCYFFVVRLLIKLNIFKRTSVFLIFLIINTFYFYLFLEKPSSAPFVPYQDYVTHIITGDPGTGPERSIFSP